MTDPQLRFAAFVLYPDDRDIDEEPILDAVLSRLQAAGAAPQADPAIGRAIAARATIGVFHRTRERVPVVVEVGAVRLTITIHPRSEGRVDWRRFAGEADWPEAAATLAQERCHVAIQEESQGGGPVDDHPDAAFDRALAVTLATEAVTMLRRPLAVLWHPAGHALSAAAFERAMRPMIAERPPLGLWAALHRNGHDGGPAVATRGLRALVGREVEAAASPFGALATEQIVVDVARRLVEGSVGLADGAEIEGPRGSRIRVEETVSASSPDQLVWHLTPAG